jgi:hypothetical protein
MSIKHNTKTLSRDVEWFCHQFESKRYSLSRWQRDDCWSHEYKKKLIESILSGIDIPKIYIGQIIDTDIETIMDGGHRTRAISGFKNNNFSITINGQEVFFDRQIDQATRNTRNLSNDEKKNFLSFELTVTTYNNITENDCRKIFNILQNAEPMTVADVINSHQSELVNYLCIISREFMVDGALLRKLIIENKFLDNADNSELLYQLASWWTIINPQLEGDDDIEEEVAMKYLEKGKTRDSKCLSYVRNHTTPITNELKEHFEGIIIYLMKYSNIKKMTSTDINTLLHSNEWIEEFSEEKFNGFLDAVSKYSAVKNKSNKKFKEGNIDEGKKLMEEADNLDSNYDGNLSVWKNSKSSGGSNFSGMTKRKNIVEKYCYE